MSFSTGTRACLGWRFAYDSVLLFLPRAIADYETRLTEIQAFVSTLVGKFEFAMTDKAERIVRLPMLVMAPMVDNELERGVQIPLVVSLAPQDGEL